MLVYRVRYTFFISLPAYRTIEFIFVEEIFYILFVIRKTKFLTDSSDDRVNKYKKKSALFTKNRPMKIHKSNIDSLSNYQIKNIF